MIKTHFSQFETKSRYIIFPIAKKGVVVKKTKKSLKYRASQVTIIMPKSLSIAYIVINIVLNIVQKWHAKI